MPPALRLAPSAPVVDETVGDVLRRAAADAPDTVALVDGVADPAARTRWTYAELLGAATRTARVLADALAPGERLAIWAPTHPGSLVLSYAAALAGVAVVPVPPLLREREAAHVLRQSGAAGVALVAEHRDHPLRTTLDTIRPHLPALRVVLDLDDADGPDGLARLARPDVDDGPPVDVPVDPAGLAQIVYTSGTTGTPKGACLTHRGMTNVGRFGSVRFGMRTGDVYVDPLPLFHVGGQVVAFEIAHARGTYVMVRAFEPALVLDLLESERADLTVAVPTMLVALLEEPDLDRRDLTRLRAVSSGGAVVSAALVREVRARLGATVTIVFGQTECCGFVTQTHLDDAPEIIEETLGPPLDGIDVRVTDPQTGEVVDLGEVGELEVRGYNVMAGYHERPEETAAAMRDGWLRTGDLVTLDADGYVRIVGRLKDVIVTGGVNVAAAEVEAAIAEHPDVAEVAVFGVPDPRWGERVTAAVRLRPHTTGDPDAVAAWLGDRLAPYKLPKQWFVVESMPVTASGKVQKWRLRQDLGLGPSPAAAGGT